MKISGFTSDKKLVVSDMFKYIGTHGLPLEVVLDKLKANHLVMDWIDYIVGALKDGHNPGTIKARVLEATGDVYGTIYRKEVEKRLDILFGI